MRSVFCQIASGSKSSSVRWHPVQRYLFAKIFICKYLYIYLRTLAWNYRPGYDKQVKDFSSVDSLQRSKFGRGHTWDWNHLYLGIGQFSKSCDVFAVTSWAQLHSWRSWWGHANMLERSSNLAIVINTNIEIHKYTNTQIHNYTYTQIHKYTNTQIHKYTNTQIHKFKNTNTATVCLLPPTYNQTLSQRKMDFQLQIRWQLLIWIHAKYQFKIQMHKAVFSDKD